MVPLIDGDVLRYEIGFSAEYTDDDGEYQIREFEFAQELLDNKIDLICEKVGADCPPTIYLTSDPYAVEEYNKKTKWVDTGRAILHHKPNFRDEIAVTKPYKGTRKPKKPYHFKNLTAYMIHAYDCMVVSGMEADDYMAIVQTLVGDNSVICSRDKDLRQVPGWHYSWQCGSQLEIGPHKTNEKGWIELRKGKVFGYGELYFLSQLLTGDIVDNIPGCPKVGPVNAFKILDEARLSRMASYKAVEGAYRGVYGEEWLPHVEEQGRLLWLRRDFEEPLWEWPYKE